MVGCLYFVITLRSLYTQRFAGSGVYKPLLPVTS